MIGLRKWSHTAIPSEDELPPTQNSPSPLVWVVQIKTVLSYVTGVARSFDIHPSIHTPILSCVSQGKNRTVVLLVAFATEQTMRSTTP